MPMHAERALICRLTTARLARQLHRANLMASVAEGRDIRSSSTALLAEARHAHAVALRRRDARAA
jgi:hypothetical protein